MTRNNDNHLRRARLTEPQYRMICDQVTAAAEDQGAFLFAGDNGHRGATVFGSRAGLATLRERVSRLVELCEEQGDGWGARVARNALERLQEDALI